MRDTRIGILLFIPVVLLLASACNRQQAPVNDLPPGWTKNVIWYQVFVERFYNGDTSNDPTPQSIRTASDFFPVPDGWEITPWTREWFAREPWADSLDRDFYSALQLRRYGGDLQGVIDKLEYLQELGITAIYLNPVNDAPSLHKYDARNYHHIDINFGPDPVRDLEIMASEDPSDPSTWKWTTADSLFLSLIREAHAKDIRIIVDYSWNHTGVEFWAWKDILENQEGSKYKDWYEIGSFDDPATPENEFDYKGWLNHKSLPELKKIGMLAPRMNGHPFEGNLHPGVKEHIYAVTRRWLAPDGKPETGVDGFRLDVADQVPLGFWRDYRRYVKSIKPEAYLVGEIWWESWPDRFMDPVPYVSGDVFDAVMFYHLYRPARSFFARLDTVIDAAGFRNSLLFQWSRLEEPFRYGMMNVASTHDSPRLLSCFYNPGKYKYHAKPSENPDYRTGKPDEDTYRRIKLYLIHQFTSIGAPHIWNGDEMGMWGADDPDCRKPLWWKEFEFQPENRGNIRDVKGEYDSVQFNDGLFRFYQKLIRIRKENDVLSSGDIGFILAEGKHLAYSRHNGQDHIIVLFNAGESGYEFRLSPPGNYLDLLDSATITGNRVFLEPLSAAIYRKIN